MYRKSLRISIASKVDFSSFGRLGFGVTSKPKKSGFSATFQVKKKLNNNKKNIKV
jgi:hypothetical protein